MTATQTLPDRAQIEKIVLEVLESRQEELFQFDDALSLGYNPLVVNVSARHVHLNQETLETLFGSDSTLTKYKTLYNGEFASDQQVNIVGSRNRMITGVRILGPIRSYNQVELSYSDGIFLGLHLPLKISGDHSDTQGCTIVGPKGSIQLRSGVIRAQRHVHMSQEDMKRYDVQDGDMVKLVVGGECGVTFDNVVVRYGEGMKLEVHIDTDEGNACNLQHAERLELIK